MNDQTGPNKNPNSFELIETMLFVHRIRFLEDHLRRLQRSASHFGFPLPLSELRTALSTLESEFEGMGRRMVRLTLDHAGHFTITNSPVPSVISGEKRICISPVRVSSSNLFFYHKTTERRLYEDEYARATAAGFYEIVFFNERGELTEAARSNIVLRVDGIFCTPPVSSGLLPGIYRKQLLHRCSLLEERPLFMKDLRNAERIYVCNAVQGLRRVDVSLFSKENR